MVMLHDSDVLTKEVLDWRGLHLFHFQGSSCSQKVRIFLRLKGIDWTSHHISLAKGEHVTPWYMGINPRGLVPALVHDGKVIVESNDILEYLEEAFPEPVLIPADRKEEMHRLLREEDNLHLDIRALTMRFVVPSFLAKKPESEIRKYEGLGSGSVQGAVDPDKAREAEFWREMIRNNGVSDERARLAFDRFRCVLEQFDGRLEGQYFLLGNQLTLLDIAWYIYVRRLCEASYPLHHLHPRMGEWFDALDARKDLSGEVRWPRGVGLITKLLHAVQRLRGTDLVQVVGLDRASDYRSRMGNLPGATQ
ncbi:glutathione S-transferase family protein [Sphingorhabdus lacus]|uniref:Glutathione S-transferase family protein n=1 Tax=Sphingorhabdus lacus TaxID=392610 RepID=A0A6I6LE69_9SPHN|nr:glutathione S-transferase family protein [Sphingorhabdus lacus]QGY80633.1 glutathione S-transferase family protein [Sphingorhabdus lacus]